jgi:hypothetical protein
VVVESLSYRKFHFGASRNTDSGGETRGKKQGEGTHIGVVLGEATVGEETLEEDASGANGQDRELQVGAGRLDKAEQGRDGEEIEPWIKLGRGESARR